MIKYFALCGATAFFCLTTTIGYSQKTNQPDYWLGLGIGKSHFPSGMVAFGYEFSNKPTLLTARYTFNGEILSDRLPGLKVSEFGMLYGVKTGKFRFSAGLSGIWGTNRGKYLSTDPDPLINGTQIYEKIKYATVGIPAEIRFITSTKDVGIGVTGFGNLNGRSSFAGLNLSFYIGQMKKS